MKKKLWWDVVVSIVLVAVVIGFGQVSSLYMPMGFEAMVVFLLVVAVIGYGAFVWKEQVQDERELTHQNKSSRVAYLAVVMVLLVALVIQGVNHEVDNWIVIGLITMILIKAGTRVYCHYRR